MASACRSSPVTRYSCQAPTATYAAWWLSAAGSVTRPDSTERGPRAVGALGLAQPPVGPPGRLAQSAGAQRHRALDVVPGVHVPVRPGDRPGPVLHPGDGLSGREHVGPLQRFPDDLLPVSHPPALGARLHGVHHQALPDQRVQRLLGEPGHGRPAHDVPDQHPVIRAGQPVLVVVHADRALEPPVRRVQPVRVVVPERGQPGPGQFGLQFDPRVDAHMPPGDLVILSGQRPADAFGQEARHRDRGQAARPQHPGRAR